MRTLQIISLSVDAYINIYVYMYTDIISSKNTGSGLELESSHKLNLVYEHFFLYSQGHRPKVFSKSHKIWGGGA